MATTNRDPPIDDATDREPPIDDGWPWNCTRCAATISQDSVYCRRCDERRHRLQVAAGRPGSVVPVVGPTLDWFDGQTYGSLVATSGAIASVEVLLTVLWLRLLFVDAIPPVLLL